MKGMKTGALTFRSEVLRGDEMPAFMHEEQEHESDRPRPSPACA